jgi:predicted RNase H-like nuclease (RuvC/YqgF family)
MTFTKSITEIATVAHTAQAKPSGINPWAAVVAVGVIIGIIASVIGILAFIQYNRQRRADREIIEIAKANVNAKDAEKNIKEVQQELGQLKALRDDLSHQISQLPGEANKLFMERQLEELSRNITRDFVEYEDIKTRLQSAAAASLAHEIKKNLSFLTPLRDYLRHV